VIASRNDGRILLPIEGDRAQSRATRVYLANPSQLEPARLESKSADDCRSFVEFLQKLGGKKNPVCSSCKEIDSSRSRSKMRLVGHDGQWRIEGPGADRAKLAFAKIAGDGLEYEIEA